MTGGTALALRVLLLSCTATAVAQPAPAPRQPLHATEAGPTWSSLSPAQQAALAPLKAQWPTIDAVGKRKWLVVAKRFPALPVGERTRVQERMAEWTRLSPVERGRARQSFQELRGLPPEDRQALWEAYRALPEEQRRQLAQRGRQPQAASQPATRSDDKRAVAVSPRAVVVKPVTPTVVQAKPGGTTTLVNKSPSPPLHHQPGMPKILASKEFVNPSTLLPSRGPQGAAAVAPLGAASPAAASAPAPASAPEAEARAPEAASSAAPATAAASAAASAP